MRTPPMLFWNVSYGKAGLCSANQQYFFDRIANCSACRTPAAEEHDEALTPVSALAAVLPGRNGGDASVSPQASTVSGASGGGPPPAGGWGRITARLQKLRADLRETQARLHTAEQVPLMRLAPFHSLSLCL